MHFGGHLFRYERGELTRDGARITLTTREIEVLRCLIASAPGRIVTRAPNWPMARIFQSAPLMCKLTALRRKIESRPARPDLSANRARCRLCAEDRLSHVVLAEPLF